MNLKKQVVTGINEILLKNVLSDSILKFDVEITDQTIAPKNNDLIIYVDKKDSKNPSSERREYKFKLNKKLNFYNNISDKFTQKTNNEISKTPIETFVSRKVKNKNNSKSLLEENSIETIDSKELQIFNGDNYIYTNYRDAIITVNYLENNNFNNELSERKTNLMNLNSDDNNATESDEGLTWDDIYFKDAFTKTGDNLNLEVNNAKIECLISSNNKFSLDKNGNLIVNSITTNQQQQQFTKQEICDFIYPIGSVYMSINSTSPATLFGGTWIRIDGYYLYAGIGGNIDGSNISGEPSNNLTGSTVLTENQIPAHKHIINDRMMVWDSGKNGASSYVTYNGAIQYYGFNSVYTENTGGGQGHTHTLNSHTHSINPLRYELYTWRRTA